jgi:hypothetical protein
VVGSQFELVHRLHGSGDPETLFKGHPKTMTPWPTAGRSKSNPRGYDPSRVEAALRNPSAHMREMDPRELHATQPWVTREGVDYYSTPEYRRTGRTFRDMDQAGNRFPVVYTDTQGRNKVISGHHRATAALIHGEQFRAIHIEE